MKVVRAAIRPFSMSVPGARAGTLRRTERKGLLLELETPDGIHAEGEASPLPGYSSDDLATCHAALSSTDWSSITEPESVAVLEHLPALPPAARFALETALLEVASRRT